MKRIILLALIFPMATYAAPSDVIATANPEAVDATTVARMVHVVKTAMETSNPEASAVMMVDAFVQAISGAPFPKDATGEFDPSASVDLSRGWSIIQGMTAQISYLALRNSFNNRNNPPGIDSGMVEWGMLAAPSRIPSATMREELRTWHERGLKPVKIEN